LGALVTVLQFTERQVRDWSFVSFFFLQFRNSYFPNNDRLLNKLDFFVSIDLLDLFMSEGYHELPEVDGTKIFHPIMIFNEEEKEKIFAPPKIVLTKEHMFSCFYK